MISNSKIVSCCSCEKGRDIAGTLSSQPCPDFFRPKNRPWFWCQKTRCGEVHISPTLSRIMWVMNARPHEPATLRNETTHDEELSRLCHTAPNRMASNLRSWSAPSAGIITPFPVIVRTPVEVLEVQGRVNPPSRLAQTFRSWTPASITSARCHHRYAAHPRSQDSGCQSLLERQRKGAK
jgi:hypothetical protein